MGKRTSEAVISLPGNPVTEDEAVNSLFSLLPDSLVESENSEEEDESKDEGTDTPSPEDDESEAEKPQDEEPEEETEEPEESEEESEEPAEDLYTVTVDGEQLQVDRDELLRGYSRTADYTRKTQKLSAERRAFEQEATSVRAEREMYKQRLTMLEQAITEATPKEPNWDALRAEDPVKFAAEYAEYNRRQKHLEGVRAEQQRVQQAELADRQRQQAAVLESERDKLLSAIPEWQDATAQRADVEKMVGYAGQLGYSPEDLAQVVDHRALMLLRKAMMYDALTAKGKAAVKGGGKRVVKPLPAGTPKGKKPSKSPGESARRRLAQSGRVKDAADALLDMIED